MSLSTTVISAVLAGKVTFDTDLTEPRFCTIGNLRFVRPVVGDCAWCLVVGAGLHHVSLARPAHWALEYARMGWQSRALIVQEGGE